MPYLPTAQDWLSQSSLLLQARPTTTRITTKYTIVNPTITKSAIKKAKHTASKATPAVADPNAGASAPPMIRANLTLKTFDPVSGVTLKYTTTKAQEVGRLIASLGRLGRHMSGLPEVKEDIVMAEDSTIASGAPVEGVSNTGGIAAPAVKTEAPTPTGGKKKKKGKK